MFVPTPTTGQASGSSLTTTMKDDTSAGAGAGAASEGPKKMTKADTNALLGQVGIAKSKKVGKQGGASRKSRLKAEMGKEKALEREAILAERVKGREERKVSPQTLLLFSFLVLS